MPENDLSKLKIEKSLPKAKARRRRPYLWAAVLAAATLAVLYFSGVLRPKVEVKTTTASEVYPSQTFTALNASGYVVAQRKASVAAKVTAQLVWLGVKEGSRIYKGEVIARLEDRDVLAARNQAAANLSQARYNLAQAQAELTDATLNLKRSTDLINKGYIARAEFDAAKARFDKAQAAVDGARSAIHSNEAALRAASVAVDYTLIRAPFDAMVLTKNADIGDIVTPIGASTESRAAVVTIADMGSLEVEADVSESNLGKVRLGQPAEIQLDALPGQRFRGLVTTIVPTADRTKATVLVKVSFIDKDKRVLPEMSAKVAFLERPVSAAEEKPRLCVNPDAVINRGGKSFVFLIKQGKAYRTPVTLDGKLGDYEIVNSGLKPGDKLALSPLDKLSNGTAVKEVEK